MQKITLPDTAKGGWRVSVPAIREALDFLEITQPIEIKLTAGLQRHGAHRVRNGVHLITVSTYLAGASASETIWHELTHAAQSEYLGEDAFAASYNQQSRYVGYTANRYEVEAREVAAAMTDELPLTKAAS